MKLNAPQSNWPKSLLACLILTAASSAQASSHPKCVTWRAHADYRGYGYHHIVDITNACQGDVACSVSTNVNKQVYKSKVGVGATWSVITQTGSPARTFTADVNCATD